MTRGTHHVILWSSLIAWSVVLHLIIWVRTEWLYLDMIFDSWYTLPGIVLVVGACLHDRRVGPALSITLLPALVVAVPSVWCYSVRWSWIAVGATLLMSVIIVRLTVQRVVFRYKPGRCRECDYDLTGNTSRVCPECGVATVGPPIPYREPRYRLPIWLVIVLILACPLIFGLAFWEQRLPSKWRIDSLVESGDFIGKTPEEVAEALNIPHHIGYVDGTETTYEFYHISDFHNWYALRLTVEDGVVASAEAYWESF